MPCIPAYARPYFRDVQDHALRAADLIEAADALLTNVLQADLAQVTVEQNRVTVQQNSDMRKISAWAAIALVPTAIAGLYGMNFDYLPAMHSRVRVLDRAGRHRRDLRRPATARSGATAGSSAGRAPLDHARRSRGRPARSVGRKRCTDPSGVTTNFSKFHMTRPALPDASGALVSSA